MILDNIKLILNVKLTRFRRRDGLDLRKQEIESQIECGFLNQEGYLRLLKVRFWAETNNLKYFKDLYWKATAVAMSVLYVSDRLRLPTCSFGAYNTTTPPRQR